MSYSLLLVPPRTSYLANIYQLFAMRMDFNSMFCLRRSFHGQLWFFELGYRSYVRTFDDISLVLGTSVVHESHRPHERARIYTRRPHRQLIANSTSSFSFRMFIAFIPKDPHDGHYMCFELLSESSFSRILYSTTGTLFPILVDYLERLSSAVLCEHARLL